MSQDWRAVANRVLASRAVNGRHRKQFLRTLPSQAVILDVGCGNGGAESCKKVRADLHYVGLDIADYNQSETALTLADEYVIVDPADFASAIEKRAEEFDAVFSAHNLEHCDEPDAVLRAMARALKSGGRLFLAFPNPASVDFPSRTGTLNFFDDETHQRPIRLPHVLRILESEGLRVDFARAGYRRRGRMLVGAVAEPFSRRRRHVLPGTWDLYGFECIVWASRG